MAEQYKPTDYMYSPDELRLLKAKASTDRLCEIAYNRYILDRSNIYKELHDTLLIRIKENIVNPLRNGTLTVQKNKAFAESIADLFNLLPKILKGLQELEKMEKSHGAPDEISMRPENIIDKVMRDGVS
ncbi:MAG: hypothetical protein ACYDHY_19145 [Acidiferrobacterales bacterium]